LVIRKERVARVLRVDCVGEGRRRAAGGAPERRGLGWFLIPARESENFKFRREPGPQPQKPAAAVAPGAGAQEASSPVRQKLFFRFVDDDELAATFAPDQHHHFWPLDLFAEANRLGGIGDRLTVELKDDVVFAEPLLRGRTVGGDAGNNGTLDTIRDPQLLAHFPRDVAHAHAVENAHVTALLSPLQAASRRFLGPPGESRCRGLRFSIAQILDLHLRFGGKLADRQQKLPRIPDRRVIDLGDHIAGLEAGLGGGAVGRHFCDESALIGAELCGEIGAKALGRDAQIATRDTAGVDDLFGGGAHEIDRHGKTHAGEAATSAEDRRIDAHDTAGAIDQRTTRVARVDGRIGLNEILNRLDPEVSATERADDSAADRLTDTKRIPDGEDNVADLQLVAVSERRRMKRIVRLDFEHRDVSQ